MENAIARGDNKRTLDDTKNNKSDSYPAKRKLLFRKRDWSKMPDDVARLVVGKLLFTNHHCRFAAGCSDWYRIARETPCPWFSTQNSPLILIPHNDDIETGTCSLYQVSDSTTFVFNVPELRGQHVHGSCKGWLVVADNDFELSLLNILTRTQIALPEPSYALDALEESVLPEDIHVSFTRDCWIKKFVVSDSPSTSPGPEGCLVAAIMTFHCKLFLCRLGDKSWTRIRLTNGMPGYHPLEDVLFFGGRLYAACEMYTIVVDFDGPARIKTAVSMRGPSWSMNEYNAGLQTLGVYLVECSGNLLYVRKFGEISDDCKRHKTCGFEVYKLEKDAHTWSRIHELCGHSVFLGLNQSVAVSAKGIPWCRPNSIYYVSDVCGDPALQGDNGVFSLEDGSIEMFHSSYSAACRASLSVWYQQKR